MRAVQVNAPELVRRWLRELVVGASVRSQLPERWSPSDGVTVTVTGDGTPVTDRGWTRENVRINVYGSSEPEVRRVAALLDGALLETGAVPGVSVVPGPGLISAPEEKLGGFIASVTVRVAATREVVSNG